MYMYIYVSYTCTCIHAQCMYSTCICTCILYTRTYVHVYMCASTMYLYVGGRFEGEGDSAETSLFLVGQEQDQNQLVWFEQFSRAQSHTGIMTHILNIHVYTLYTYMYNIGRNVQCTYAVVCTCMYGMHCTCIYIEEHRFT